MERESQVNLGRGKEGETSKKNFFKFDTRGGTDGKDHSLFSKGGSQRRGAENIRR